MRQKLFIFLTCGHTPTKYDELLPGGCRITSAYYITACSFFIMPSYLIFDWIYFSAAKAIINEIEITPTPPHINVALNNP